MRAQSWLGSSNANTEGNSKLEVMGARGTPPAQSTGPKCVAVHGAPQGLQRAHQISFCTPSSTGWMAMLSLGHSCPIIGNGHTSALLQHGVCSFSWSPRSDGYSTTATTPTTTALLHAVVQQLSLSKSLPSVF